MLVLLKGSCQCRLSYSHTKHWIIDSGVRRQVVSDNALDHSIVGIDPAEAIDS